MREERKKKKNKQKARRPKAKLHVQEVHHAAAEEPAETKSVNEEPSTSEVLPE